MPEIMLIEDDPTVLTLLSRLLEIEGFQVLFPESKRDLLADLRQRKPHLILIDVHLKDVNGLDLLSALREDEELGKTKVIMSSGMDLSEESLAKGADDFILKPYMPNDLVAKIKQQLKN